MSPKLGAVLTEAQVQALEKKQDDDVAHGEIETAHPGYLGSQDTFYVGTLKGVGRIYQQTFVDTYSKWAAAKLYTTKTPITSADLLNDRVLPFFAEQGIGVIRILTDRGTEYCGKPEHHDYQLYLALNEIEHSRTKANHPQTNGICERFTKPSCRSSTRWHSGARFTSPSKSYSTIWMTGWRTTTVRVLTKARCAVDAPRYKL
jgi:transposase InsO family protein